jgi:uncharacterized phage protein (TIGR01671 family)
MREYLFRGKRLDNKMWIYGDLIQNSFSDCKYILPVEAQDMTEYKEIDPDTLGQLIPIKDADNNTMYEGDIVAGMRTPDNFHPAHSILPQKMEYRMVEYQNSKTKSCFELPKDLSYSERSPENNIQWRLVGNKWDNPELLQSL